MAAKKYFDQELDFVECLTFKDLCDSLKKGHSDYALMAIENTVAGSLLPNYALLKDYDFKIIGEVYLRINMNFMALPGQTIEDIRTVQSHPIALRQCNEFLWSLSNLEIREHDDTALAAKDIQVNNKMGTAAIGNSLTAELYGLEILKENVETNRKNFTRFLVLSRKAEANPKSCNKASLSFQLGHAVGSLADILHVFKSHEINLTKIQSIPILGKPYEYSFNVDVEWKDLSMYQAALHEVLKQSTSLTVLGEYEKGDFNTHTL